MNKHTVESVNEISALVDQGKELAENVRDKALSSVKATHKAVQAHPYKAIGIALGVGAIIGFFLARRSHKD